MSNTDKELQALFDRVDRLEEEKAGIAADIRDVYAEAKAKGYDPKVMRRIRAQAKLAPDVRKELNALVQSYADAIGLDLL